MPSIKNNNPTFDAVVEIKTPGTQDDIEVVLTYKYMTKDEVEKYNDKIASENCSDVDVTMDLVQGWNFDEEFNRENVEILEQNYMGALGNFYLTYLKEITGARVKN